MARIIAVLTREDLVSATSGVCLRHAIPSRWPARVFRRAQATCTVTTVNVANYLQLSDLPGHLAEHHHITGRDGGPLSHATVEGYHRHTAKRRRDGTSRPGDLPPPDRTFGRSPVWVSQTIDAWARSRPGRGAGGGRPKK